MIKPWLLSDLHKVKSNGLKVFSTFCCGGGSSMGYRLAGFESVGGLDIDPEMADLYNHNLKPRQMFVGPIQKFRELLTFPPELLGLDVLDGSPPCSSFSMAGSREDAWGKQKKFREGQADQVLDDLFFHFIKLADRLRPKVIVAENVKGLIMGNARGYVKWIFEELDAAGYDAQLFLMNAAKMGVPQSRQRTFFIARRKDLSLPTIEMSFNEPPISCEQAFEGLAEDATGKRLTELGERYWRATARGKSFAKAAAGSWFNWRKLHPKLPSPTMPATCQHTRWDEPRFISFSEAKRLQSFPDDYDFKDADGRYVCGMSVPPLMMQKIASKIATMLLK